MREIRGNAKNLRSLLGNAKFALDYYQRGYRWKRKQVEELINDLVEKFNESYKPEDERNAVTNYGHYFLGSIIISDKEGQQFIIDGQQRLTTLTLLLIHIYRLLDNNEAQLAELIFSTKYGTRSFNIDVPERKECMDALFNHSDFDETGQPESVVNIIHRFQNVMDLFPDDLTGAALPYFADWLIENVHLVEITAYSDADAYIIFETMNDRGLSLTPTEMLKGYILANIKDPSRRNEANQHWQKQVSRLQDINKKEDADAIKAWLRSKYACTIRERKRDAAPRDFDLIGTEFHRWVRDHKEDLKLSSSDDYARFIEKDFNFYGDWYIRLHKAAKEMTKGLGLEAIHYCAQNDFTLQYPVLLAPLRCEDSEQDNMRKLRIVSAYLDILITRRIWNGRNIGYSTMQYTMFQTMRAIRNQDPLTLVDLLTKRLSEDEQTFATNNQFRLNKANRKKIRRLLARLIDYIETSSGQLSRYQEYIQFEIEHIWADNFERHSNEFEHPNEFSEYRDRIGGLLLLPKSFNASYGALPYEEKRNYYLQHDLLAQSLHEEAYEHNPGFKRFISDSGLSFKSHPQFQKNDLDERQELYRYLAEKIWNPERLRQAYEAEA